MIKTTELLLWGSCGAEILLEIEHLFTLFVFLPCVVNIFEHFPAVLAHGHSFGCNLKTLIIFLFETQVGRTSIFH